MFQYFDFNHGLLVESLPVPYQLERALLLPFVVEHFHNLSETALT